jgi:hypothetical protein
MYKVRFNLGRGANYMKWKVEHIASGKAAYYDPEEVSLSLHGCALRNQPSTAQKIFEGANKSVCAWVECHDVEISLADCVSFPIEYNPRKAPHWSGMGQNIDNTKFARLVSDGRNLFVADLGEYYIGKNGIYSPARAVRQTKQLQSRTNVRRRRPRAERHNPSGLLA